MKRNERKLVAEKMEEILADAEAKVLPWLERVETAAALGEGGEERHGYEAGEMIAGDDGW